VGLPLTARLVTLRLNKLRRLEGVTMKLALIALGCLRRQALSTRLARFRSLTMDWFDREPTLDGMLSDSIVRAVMEADLSTHTT
jgi:hypothetical protein